MLSYRHGFHAGNHADVLKHVVLLQLLAQLTQKDKPLWVIDTHAGAGCYSLAEGFAARNAEFENGIGRLWSRRDLPAALADYVEAVRVVNPDGALRFELHTTESRELQTYFHSAGRRVAVVAGDGFAGMRAVLPPPSRRGLALVDPSYETTSDYRAVLAAIRDAMQRFATGVYAVWYPQIPRRESEQLPEQLRRLATGDWLHVALRVRAPATDGFGLHGSGMFVFNPPWNLEKTLRPALPMLVAALGQDDRATFDLQFRQT
jgi:23S rRNA (adenine2030-N6)-methyltransferase